MTTVTRPVTAAIGTMNDPDAHPWGRLRWAVRAVLTLGVAASIAANVLHARPNPISQLIAAWPPLALLLTVELISRIPTHRRAIATVRLVATAVIAGIAAWVSYWHMVGVAARYGENGAACYLLPISVDGLVVVASISLVEIAARTPRPCIPAVAARVASRDLPGDTFPVPAAPERSTRTGSAPPLRLSSTGLPTTGASPPEPAITDQRPVDGVHPPAPDADIRRRGTTSRRRLTPEGPHHDDGGASEANDGAVSDGDQVPSDTAAAVAYWHQRDPALHPADIAAKINRSERTVRRHWPPTSPPPRTDQPVGRRLDGQSSR